MHSPSTGASRNPRTSCTPPPSDHTRSLPTPPSSTEKTLTHLSAAAAQALQLIRDCHRGFPPDRLWTKIHLQRGDYQKLEQQLKDEDLWGYVEDKIRCDWDPRVHELIYRMQSPTHDICTAQVVDEIRFQLRQIGIDNSACNPRLTAISSSIINRSTSRVYLLGDPTDDNEYSKRSPDASFAHLNADYPGVVIETSFSQKRKDLPRLAEDYIMGSVANISVVIGLDIEYQGSKKATVSVWRPEEGIDANNAPFLRVNEVVKAEPFRNEDGTVVPEGKLTLSLGDFVPGEIISDIAEPLPTLEIPFLKLAGFLQLSEAHHQISETKTGIGRKELAPGTRLLKRSISPEEELRPETEQMFVESEEDADEKVQRGDGPYRQKVHGKSRKTEK
ncbi:MAG: hypothetical protein M1813_005238 [Trichoglossum hirsutum]|nr:MAG: hypothetical protein M1813_005238 [Trichoglossum hirsutum]